MSTIAISSPSKKSFDLSLEGLRGLAAFLVVLSHALDQLSSPDSHFYPTGFWRYYAPGHLSVLVFFLLSGFVIGISNKKPVQSLQQVKIYTKKRLIRLYPLYLISIFLTIVVASLYKHYYSYKDILSYIIFLQSIYTKVPDYNQPIWSLSYEILYYILFLVISRFNINATYSALGFIGIGIITTYLPNSHIVIASYAYGAVFWLTGLALSKISETHTKINYGKILSWLVLLLCFEKLNIFYNILSILNLDVKSIIHPYFFDRSIIFSDLSYLIFCVPIICIFSNRKPKWLPMLEYIAFASPLFFIIGCVATGKILSIDTLSNYLNSMLLYTLSLFIIIFNNIFSLTGRKILTYLIPLGSISYGIYIIHFPLLGIFRYISAFSGTPITFIIRLIIYLFVTLFLGWILEKKIQPIVASKII